MLFNLVTILNWLVVLILGFFVVFGFLSPPKGGDAASQGIGQGIFYLAIITVVVLIIVNLLPYPWARYTAFGLVVLMALFVMLFLYWPTVRERERIKQNEDRYKMEKAQPIFEDDQRDQIARAIRDGDLEKVKILLQTPVEKLNENGSLLFFAINEAHGARYRQEEKLECVKLLFKMGAKLDSIKADVPAHMAVADVGDVVLLRFLLEHGADPNAYHINFNRPILFIAITSHNEPEAVVRTLLEFGADPNVQADMKYEEGPISALYFAASRDRWGVCAALLEHGADPEFKAKGNSFRNLVKNGEQGLYENGYSTKEDFERMKKVLARSANQNPIKRKGQK